LSGISQSELDEIFGNLLFRSFKLQTSFEGTKSDRARLRTFTSQLVGRFINDLTLAEPPGTQTVVRDQESEREIAVLKQLTWFYVIEAPGSQNKFQRITGQSRLA